MPYIDPTGVNLGWSLEPQEGLGLTAYVEGEPSIAPVIPRSVTRYQARAALLEAGLLGSVEAHFSMLPDTSLDRLAWQEAPTVNRDGEALQGAAAALGLTEEQVDALFVRAVQFV